jgi:hypothetical protein
MNPGCGTSIAGMVILSKGFRFAGEPIKSVANCNGFGCGGSPAQKSASRGSYFAI